MRTHLIPTVVFDLDGTLVDTVPDIAAALDETLVRFGSSATSISEAAAMMGDGLSAFFWKAITAKRLSLPAAEASAALKDFIAAYQREPVQLSRVYPGIEELLGELGDRGVRMAVCTNKLEPIALEILERLKIRNAFDAVVGYRDDHPKKPDPWPVLRAISLSGGHARGAWMVGDTAADLGAAGTAEVQPILVDYGYCAVPVRTLGAAIVVDTVSELRQVLIDGIDDALERGFDKAS